LALRLNRETLAELTADDLAQLAGGAPPQPTPPTQRTLQVRQCFILVTADEACLGPTLRDCIR
jgi:hypothetical protein